MRDFRDFPLFSPRLLSEDAAHGRSRVVSVRVGAATLLALIPLLLAGCKSPLARVDAATERLIRDRSASLGGGAVAPRIEGRSGTPTPGSRGMYQTDLPTTNPDASELIFTPAQADRNVADRLARYASESLPMPGESGAENVRTITLTEAFRLSQSRGREFRLAEEDYILSAISVLIERHLWGPRLFNDTRVALSGAGDDGRFEHALDLINTLRITKRLPYGGSVEARWIVAAGGAGADLRRPQL